MRVKTEEGFPHACFTVMRASRLTFLDLNHHALDNSDMIRIEKG